MTANTAGSSPNFMMKSFSAPSRPRCRPLAASLLLAAAVLVGSAALHAAEVSLANIFNDNMVVQRDRPVPVWGWADPGTAVSVAFNGKSETAKADASGKWLVRLAALPAGGPYEIAVTSPGGKPLAVRNVLVGDVWLCSGQSNMAFGLGGCDAAEDIAAADFPQIRAVFLDEHFAAEPQRDVPENNWQAISPQTVSRYSGVAFYFARKVQSETKIPIGILISSVGGTEIECWMSAEAINGYPENASAAEAYNKAIQTWEKELAASRPGPWQEPIGLDEAATWVAAARTALTASNTPLDPQFTAFEAWIPAAKAALAAGKPVPTPPSLEKLGFWIKKTPLAAGFKGIPLAPHPLTDRHGVGGHGWFRTQSLYNGMIYPLAPFAFKGMLWYQGENGSGPGADAYFHRMRGLIETMRKEWQNPFPFYYVQIANWRDAPGAEPQTQDLAWPITRQAQLKALEIPHTGMAVAIDVGDALDIHPKNKRDVGERLALWALARDYGKKDLVFSGPLFKAARVEGSKIRVVFDSLGGGLMAGKKPPFGPAVEDKGAKLTQFAIAGEDKKWVWAEAVIDGASVVVSSPQVPAPVAVRYAFAGNPQGCNLYNKAGLPASPFRSDTW
jgi:sialate O-acetylesterase